MKRTRIKEILQNPEVGYAVNVKGWVRSFRNNQFIALNDGSTINNLQIVISLEGMDEAVLKTITAGASMNIDGTVVASLGKGQTVEIKADKIEVTGDLRP